MGSDPAQKLAEKVTAVRDYFGLSKNEFAKRTGMSPTHVARLEKGVTVPQINVLKKISTTFHIDYSYFGEDAEPGDVVGYILAEDGGEERDGRTEAERLAALRYRKGMTQKELGERSGCSQSVIAVAELGKRKLTGENAERVAEILEVGVDYLVDGVKSKEYYPVNRRLAGWLWKHQEVREELWKRMKEEEGETAGLVEK